MTEKKCIGGKAFCVCVCTCMCLCVCVCVCVRERERERERERVYVDRFYVHGNMVLVLCFFFQRHGMYIIRFEFL